MLTQVGFKSHICNSKVHVFHDTDRWDLSYTSNSLQLSACHDRMLFKKKLPESRSRLVHNVPYGQSVRLPATTTSHYSPAPILLHHKEFCVASSTRNRFMARCKSTLASVSEIHSKLSSICFMVSCRRSYDERWW
jgi:hypothetical protein